MADKNAADLSFLGESSLFSGLGESEINRLMEIAQVQEFKSGDTIVEQGTDGDAVYLLCEGSVTVSAAGRSGDEIRLATLSERGAFFGEVTVVDPGPRSATVRAETDAVLVKVTVAGLEQFFEELKEAEPVVLRNIARVLAGRLRDSNLLLGAR
jgi:CRP-like cAMP-binding protein